MINEYVLKVGVISDKFETVMQFCSEEEYEYYKNLVDFIELENSLLQPELSDKVCSESPAFLKTFFQFKFSIFA